MSRTNRPEESPQTLDVKFTIIEKDDERIEYREAPVPYEPRVRNDGCIDLLQLSVLKKDRLSGGAQRFWSNLKRIGCLGVNAYRGHRPQPFNR